MHGSGGTGAPVPGALTLQQPHTRRWTGAQLTEAIAGVSGGGAAPSSWADLSEAQQALYAVRVSQDPPMSLPDAALALGITRGAAEERWMQVRLLTGCPAMAATRSVQLAEEAPAVTAPIPEHVSDTDLVLLARRKAYEGLVACDPIARPREFKDLTAAVATAMRTSHEIAAAPLELRRRDDREGLRELAQGLLTEMAKRGVSLHASAAPVVDGEFRAEPEAPGLAREAETSHPLPGDPLADV